MITAIEQIHGAIARANSKYEAWRACHPVPVQQIARPFGSLRRIPTPALQAAHAALVARLQTLSFRQDEPGLSCMEKRDDIALELATRRLDARMVAGGYVREEALR